MLPRIVRGVSRAAAATGGRRGVVAGQAAITGSGLAGSQPPRQKAFRHFLSREREGPVVRPFAVDVQEPGPESLVAKPEFLHHPQARTRSPA